jgi:hypothetical protein
MLLKNNVLLLAFYFPEKEIMQTYQFTTVYVIQIWKHYIDIYTIFTNIQGEHKVFSWLQTFTTSKLHGIQTYNM